jgi:CheY-like chemotaxis protein
MRRILLIEDDPISQDIIRSLLLTTGASVDVASDGISGLEAARSGQYDALLIDYHLPEMDGYAIGRLLRHEAATAALKSPDAAMNQPRGPMLIGLTADRNGLAARRGSDAVFHAILTKPITPAALFGTLDRLCPVTAAQPVAGHALPDDPRRAALGLWQERGLAGLPRALVLPAPLPEQRAALDLCFALVEPAQAEIVLLIERHGINAAKALKAGRAGQVLPIFALCDDLAAIADGVFKVDEPASWQRLATALGGGAAPVPAAARAVAEMPAPAPIRTEVPEPAAAPARAPAPAALSKAPALAGRDGGSDPAAWAAIIRRDIHEPVNEIHRSFSALAVSATDPALKAYMARVAGALGDVGHVAHALALTLDGVVANQVLATVPAANVAAPLEHGPSDPEPEPPEARVPQAPALDAGTHAAMVNALGRSAVLSLTDRLLGDIERLVRGDDAAGDSTSPDQAARLQGVADMAATAAMFGFRELARVCSGLSDTDGVCRPDPALVRSEAMRARLARDETLKMA